MVSSRERGCLDDATFFVLEGGWLNWLASLVEPEALPFGGLLLSTLIVLPSSWVSFKTEAAFRSLSEAI